MYILIEGVDLSGKSSIRKYLNRNDILWGKRHMSLLKFNALYEMARSIPKNGAEWIGYLYEGALVYDLDAFEKPDGNTIQDSTILLRSLAYHKAAGFEDVVARFERLAERHPSFDAVFVLTASVEARMQRLNERISRTGSRITRNDRLIVTNTDFFVRMDKLLIEYTKKFYPNAIVMDTSNMDIETVVRGMGI
jgi:thymidylate kinase